jgi:hypothetical protein
VSRTTTYVAEEMQTRIGRHAVTPNTLMLECHRHVSMIYRHICRKYTYVAEEMQMSDCHRHMSMIYRHLCRGYTDMLKEIGDVPTHMAVIPWYVTDNHLRIGRNADTRRKTHRHSKHLDVGMSPICVGDISTHMSLIHRFLSMTYQRCIEEVRNLILDEPLLKWAIVGTEG